ELQIQDSSLSLESIDSQLLGPGFRCGFLGLLHREIIGERLKKEYNCEIITTPPSITYRVNYSNDESLEANNPQKISTKDKIKTIEELFISLSITTPEEYLGAITQLCQNKREFILDFHDKIKSISHGYASFDYQIIVHRSFAYERAKTTCEQLKLTLNQQNFTVPIQATIGNQVIARETLPALKKHQKKGKARMKEMGKVSFGADKIDKAVDDETGASATGITGLGWLEEGCCDTAQGKALKGAMDGMKTELE
ncbi:7941_t:CDS:2, partial [Ambispora gerdemannii]